MKDFTDSLVEAYRPDRALEEEVTRKDPRKDHILARVLGMFLRLHVAPALSSRISNVADGSAYTYRLRVYNDAQPYYESEDDPSGNYEYYKDDPAVEEGSEASVYSSDRAALEAAIDAILQSGAEGDEDEAILDYLAFPGIDAPFDDNTQFGGGIELYSPAGDEIESYRILAYTGPRADTYFKTTTKVPRKKNGSRGRP